MLAHRVEPRQLSQTLPAKNDNMPDTSVKPLLCSSPVQDYIEQLHTEFRCVTDGQVPTYIPELAKAEPSWFGICLVTMNGAVYEIGDSRQQFTIQSISKPFVYGLALEDQWESGNGARTALSTAVSARKKNKTNDPAKRSK